MAELRYFSFSRSDADETCRRKRYLNSEWGSTGLNAVNEGWDATYGTIIHKHLADLAKGSEINYFAARKEAYEAALAAKLPPLVARDWGALAEGHLRGFVRCVWPRWLAEFEVVEAERLRSWDAQGHFYEDRKGLDNGLWGPTVEQLCRHCGGLDSSPHCVYRFRYRQDLLLRNRFNGEIVMVDYKTTGSDDAKWVASWAKHPQLHSSAYAMKQQGIQIDYMMIQGLFKSWKDKKTGGLTSIFCKGWVNREFSMMPEYSYEYKRAKGWEAFSPAEEFEDLADWVANMPESVLTAQFPATGPIAPRDDIGERWFRQQLIREAEVAEAVQQLQACQDDACADAILDRAFRQNFTRCQPGFGYECEFQQNCWIPSVGADPLGSGLYKRREPQFEDGDGG